MERQRVVRNIERLAEKIESKGYKLVKVYLYGSYAKGSAHEFSDIDVAFVSPDFHPNQFMSGRRS